METQQWIPFALLSSYKTFRTAVNNSKYQILCVFVWIIVVLVRDSNHIFSVPCHIALVRDSNHIFSVPCHIAIFVLTGLCRVQLKCDDARWRKGGGKWRGNWRMEWVASTLHTTSEHGLSSITTADAHTSAASSRLKWRPPADLNGLANGVGSQYSSHYLGTWSIQHYYRWCAHLGCQ